MPGADRAQVESACNLSLARYLKEPERYQPERGPLVPWLIRDVRGDVLNELTSASTQREQANSDVIELRSGAGNVLQDRSQLRPVDEDALDLADPYDLAPDVLAAAHREAATLSAEGRAVVELMGEGVRETAAYAEVLGISHLPAHQQRVTVKRVKDRLARQLERMRERLG